MTSADFDLPGPVVLERGDVARLLGERAAVAAIATTHALDKVAAQTIGRPGLVPCATCGSLQAPRAEGGQLGVHYPTLADMRPCPGSWPAKVVRR